MAALAETTFPVEIEKVQATLFESNIRPTQGDSTQTTIYRILQQNIPVTNRYCDFVTKIEKKKTVT